MRAKTLVTTVGAVSVSAFVLYPAWCAFATLLSTSIWQLNRDD
jgi:tryptophan-rich sensory protein